MSKLKLGITVVTFCFVNLYTYLIYANSDKLNDQLLLDNKFDIHEIMQGSNADGDCISSSSLLNSNVLDTIEHSLAISNEHPVVKAKNKNVKFSDKVKVRLMQEASSDVTEFERPLGIISEDQDTRPVNFTKEQKKALEVRLMELERKDMEIDYSETIQQVLKDFKKVDMDLETLQGKIADRHKSRIFSLEFQKKIEGIRLDIAAQSKILLRNENQLGKIEEAMKNALEAVSALTEKEAKKFEAVLKPIIKEYIDKTDTIKSSINSIIDSIINLEILESKLMASEENAYSSLVNILKNGSN